MEDFLFAYKVVKTPTNPKAPPKQFVTYYLSARKYYVYYGKLSVDKNWENAGGLFVISGDWMSPHFDGSPFSLINKFTHCEFYCCSTLLFFIFYYFPSNELSQTFKILLLSVIPMATNVNLPKEWIDALLAAYVYHLDPSNAWDLDSICTAKAMQCLVGYALRPSFLDSAFTVAIKLA